jgi:amino acid transporter
MSQSPNLKQRRLVDDPEQNAESPAPVTPAPKHGSCLARELGLVPWIKWLLVGLVTLVTFLTTVTVKPYLSAVLIFTLLSFVVFVIVSIRTIFMDETNARYQGTRISKRERSELAIRDTVHLVCFATLCLAAVYVKIQHE